MDILRAMVSYVYHIKFLLAQTKLGQILEIHVGNSCQEIGEGLWTLITRCKNNKGLPCEEVSETSSST